MIDLNSEMYDMTFAEKVKFVRAKLLISQKELAKQVGVSVVTVTRWE